MILRRVNTPTHSSAIISDLYGVQPNIPIFYSKKLDFQCAKLRKTFFYPLTSNHFFEIARKLPLYLVKTPDIRPQN